MEINFQQKLHLIETMFIVNTLPHKKNTPKKPSKHIGNSECSDGMTAE